MVYFSNASQTALFPLFKLWSGYMHLGLHRIATAFVHILYFVGQLFQYNKAIFVLMVAFYSTKAPELSDYVQALPKEAKERYLH